MIKHYRRSVKDEEYWGRPSVCGFREDCDIANHTPFGLMRRAEKLDPDWFDVFCDGVSTNVT